MSIKTEPLSSWLKQIPGDLYKLDEKPLLGFPPEFPWKTFSSNLANSLQIKALSIKAENVQWRAETELFEGLNDGLKILPLAVNPLEGLIWWVMSEQGAYRLMNLLLNNHSKPSSDPIEDSFFKAFFHFLAAEVIQSFEKVDFDKKLAPVVLQEFHLPKEACLGMDIPIAIGDELIYGRLLLSQPFRKSWMQRYAQQQKSLALLSPIAEAIQVVVHLEAGKINLKPSEWKRIAAGDFIILDSCSIEPNEDKGRVMLTINGSPFFRAKIKQGSLKILEHPLYYEVDRAMENPPKENEEEDHDDEAFDDADFDFDEEEVEDSLHSENENLSESKDEDILDPDHLKVESSDKANTTKIIPSTPLSMDEIPMTIVIEVARIQMSIKKLLELQPGNMLDLDIHPESGVDLVINGRRIARGELLKIGDALGIRILELS